MPGRLIETLKHGQHGAAFRVPSGFTGFEADDVLVSVDGELDFESDDGDVVALAPLEWWEIERVSESSYRLVRRLGLLSSIWRYLTCHP